MKRIALPKHAVKQIHVAVDDVFDRAVARFLKRPPVGKRIVIGFTPRVSLPSLFDAASFEERNKADQEILKSLLDVAQGYIDAQRSRTKAAVTRIVEGWVNDLRARGDEPDVDAILTGELAKVWGSALQGMTKIIDTEATTVRNTGTLDGIIKINASAGIEDPVVFFVVVRDDSLCSECKRLHLLPDGNPRLWRLSELGHGYHTKGQDNPKLCGLHPHCRCSLATLMPGYGFEGGNVAFVKLDHDEYAKQQSQNE